jgi:hypothetical protein
MKQMLAVVAVFAAVVTSGCVRGAQIRVPEELAAQSDTLELKGMGGGRHGTFRLGPDTGEFIRGADRLGILDPLLIRNSGGGSFRILLAGQPLEGACSYRAEQLTVGVISAPTRPFSYQCRFSRGGRPLDAQLFVRAVPNAIGKDERRGFLEFEGRRFTLQSVHRDIAGGLPTRAPLGYVFEVEGRPVAAIDLNGPNKTLHITRGPERDAVIAGSLALAILWDPAEVG